MVGGWFWQMQLKSSLRQEARTELAHFDKLHAAVTTAFEDLHHIGAAPPCSEEFIRELRRVAFKPDGLNEFMYAPGGIVACSTSIQRAAIPLGPPDIAPRGADGIAFWINKRLDRLGLPDMVGSIAFQEPFALVIPPPTAAPLPAAWVSRQFVMTAPDHRVWHLGGNEGLFDVISQPHSNSAPLSTMHDIVCGEQNRFCVAVKADLAQIAFDWKTELILAVALIGFYAIWPATVLSRALDKYWSLESRFRRNLNAASIICAYQPILDLRTGKISSVEVLARWRDLDGTIVAPDKFINIVERTGQTLVFTKMVADRAYDELSRALPPDTRLQVNFNIFPRDLDCEKLRGAFSAFAAEPHRFQIVLEIVESDALGDNAHREIEALARIGMQTYIDDFGSGYSSLHRVASLAVHGVKLDRSFAMAPSDSLLARMLVHALDMASSSGREIVVEGVETQERLDLLTATGRVGYVQGYLISQPLPIERLAEFLANHDAAAALAGNARQAA